MLYCNSVNIKDIRKQKGYTQKEISKSLGIPLRTYIRYEMDEDLSSLKKDFLVHQINELEPKIKKTNKQKRMKIAIAGIGYVGLSLAILLSQCHDVTLVDINEEKINLINQRKSPLKDDLIEQYLKSKKLSICAKKSSKEAYFHQNYVIVATPTDFDKKTNSFNLEHVDEVIKLVREIDKKVPIIIKSTVSLGYCSSLKDKHLYFSPEFLREGNALYDNLYPSRIIVGADSVSPEIIQFASLLERCSLNKVKTIYMSLSEAEAVKLFSNAYLAMRVAYFNELDTYAESKGLDTSKIIEGISLDPRIGNYYNNPSFGYGGYCLPKDSKQLRSSFLDIPNNDLIKAITSSNESRKNYIAEQIIQVAKTLSHKSDKDIAIGVYRLVMKTNSDNYRNASILDIISILKDKGIKVIIYEPLYKGEEKIDDIHSFFKQSDIIVANRFSKELKEVKDKVYTRDIFSRD